MPLFRAVFLVLGLASAATAAAQQPTTPAPAASTTISVFLDCQDVHCDFDYFRTEIQAVNWVRDREVSDVHILITGQETGAGGRDLAITFIGLRRFAGLTDTLHLVLPPSSTDDERRTGLAQMFRAGLVRYVARTPESSKITIALGDAGQRTSQASTKSDPWKAWVMSVGMNGFSFGDQNFVYYNLNGRLSANRITEAWKTQFSGREGYNEERNYYTRDTVFKPTATGIDTVPPKDTVDVFIRRSFFFSLLHVKAVTPHLSIGLRSDASASTFENTTRSIRAAPAIEYNVFPYSEATRHVLKVEYAAGLATYVYKDTTVYDKLAETLPLHRLQISASQRQPWGQVDVSISGSQFLHDQGKYRISAYGGVEFRIAKGLRFSIDGGYENIHDQLSLLKKGLSPAELLLRRQQRGTSYSYNYSVGINYTFGSIFNNVVNPRFD